MTSSQIFRVIEQAIADDISLFDQYLKVKGEDLMIATLNQNANILLQHLRTGKEDLSNGHFKTIQLQHLAHAAAAAMLSEAYHLAFELAKHTDKLDTTLSLIQSGVPGAAAFSIYIGSEFKYNIMTHDLECGFEPSEAYTKLANSPDIDKDKLNQLAYLLVRMPDKIQKSPGG